MRAACSTLAPPLDGRFDAHLPPRMLSNVEKTHGVLALALPKQRVTPVTEVVKRDGRHVASDPTRITRAVSLAFFAER